MKGIGVFLTLIALCYVGPVQAEKHSNPAGFSFNYPSGWVPLTGASLVEMRKSIPSGLSTWIEGNEAGSTSTSVMLIRFGFGEFLENVNVSVQNRQIEVSRQSASDLTESTRKQIEWMGAWVDDLKGRAARIGSRDVIVCDLKVKLPFVSTQMRQRQVIIPGGGKTFVVTCSATVDSFEKYESVFDGVIESFDAPLPIPTGFDWGTVRKGALFGGMVGASVLGAVAVLVVIAKLYSKWNARRD